MAIKELRKPAIADQSGKEIEDMELNDEELDEVSGGIIIVGGGAKVNKFLNPHLSYSELNPQPLPPSLNKIQGLGGPDTKGLSK